MDGPRRSAVPLCEAMEEPSAKRRCCTRDARDDDERNVPPTDHTQLVHNLYRHILSDSRTEMPDWRRFELRVSLSTGTFGMDMMPPSFLDDESPVLVDKKGHGVDCGIDHISLDKTVVGQSKRYTGTNKVDWPDITRFHGAYECLATPPGTRFLATLPETGVTERVSDFMRLKRIEHRTFDDATLVPARSVSTASARTDAGELALRPSQADVVSAFLASSRKTFTLQAAPGWGKTRIALALGRETIRRGGRVLYLVHTVDLLAQTRATFGAAGVAAEVSTYQGAHKLAALTRKDLLVADEAHHLDKEGVWKGHVLRVGEACRTFQMSGMYASGTDVDFDVSYDTAIEEGVVADYRVVLQYWSEGVRTKEVARFVHETPTLGPLVFVFWNTVENAEAGHRASVHLLDSSVVVTGKTPDAERERILRLAEDGHYRVMHLCGCYNEGISISSVSTVVFGDPRQSVKNVFQCQARANRLHPTKPFYRVVLPILGDADLDVVSQYVGVLATSDDRVHDAVVRMTNGLPTARVVVGGTRDGEAAYERVVEYLGATIRSLVDEKIEALVALERRPKQKDVVSVRRGGEEVTFLVGRFWNHIQTNWKDGRKPPLRLSEEQKERVEQATWFASALSSLKEKWDAREQAAFVPTVDEKIEALVALKARPKKKDVAFVRRGDEEVVLKIGHFWNHIQQNWKKKGGRPRMLLLEEQKKRVQEATWFASALSSLKTKWDARDQAAFDPTVDERIEALVALEARPKQKDVVFVRRGGEEVTFPVGQFWNHIQTNWKECGKRPNTLLVERQRRRVEQATWFASALSSLKTKWDA